MRPIHLVLATLACLAPLATQAQQLTPLPSLQRGQAAEEIRGIEATQQLPGGSFNAVKVKDRQGLYFLSSDGRILIKGTAYDLWAGRRLTSLEEVRRTATHLNLEGLAQLWPQLDPIALGQGPRTVVAFVAPGCPHCQQLMDTARGLTDRYRFLLLPIPAGNQGGGVIRSLACARDRPEAEAAFVRHQLLPDIEQTAACDLQAVQRRIITAQLLGIQSVPWIVRQDGAVSTGMPPDLAAWLQDTAS
jgi:thiol:disulfide interchange protein DsbC